MRGGRARGDAPVKPRAHDTASAPAPLPRSQGQPWYSGHGAGPIIFVIYADEIGLMSLRHFIGPLGPDQRVVGLLPERVDGRFDLSCGVRERALKMMETIRTQQPDGPYLLAGYSLGGYLAYEIAGELRAAGSEVAWLGILDTISPARIDRYFRNLARMNRRWRRERFVRLGPWGAARRITEVSLGQLRRRVSRAAVEAEGSTPLTGFDYAGAWSLAKAYACRGHDAPLELFATEHQIVETGSPSLGWDELHCGPLTVRVASGTHMTMLTHPHVGPVAEQVARSRDAALATSSAVSG